MLYFKNGKFYTTYFDSNVPFSTYIKGVPSVNTVAIIPVNEVEHSSQILTPIPVCSVPSVEDLSDEIYSGGFSGPGENWNLLFLFNEHRQLIKVQVRKTSTIVATHDFAPAELPVYAAQFSMYANRGTGSTIDPVLFFKNLDNVWYEVYVAFDQMRGTVTVACAEIGIYPGGYGTSSIFDSSTYYGNHDAFASNMQDLFDDLNIEDALDSADYVNR